MCGWGRCPRIATHVSWFLSLPSLTRNLCGEHAIEAVGNGETFMPADWLIGVGVATLEERQRSIQFRP